MDAIEVEKILRITKGKRISKWFKIDLKTGCWNWIRFVNDQGYGHTWDNVKRKNAYAHRFIYEMVKGPIPKGLTLDHLCRNRKCVNPQHLEPVTNKENLARGESFSSKNSAKTHCLRGHALTAENIYRPPKHKTQRHCKQCKLLRQRKDFKTLPAEQDLREKSNEVS